MCPLFCVLVSCLWRPMVSSNITFLVQKFAPAREGFVIFFFLLLSLNSLAQVCTHLSGLELITTILGPFSWLRIHYNFVPIFLGQNLLQFFAHISASEFIAILCPFFWVRVYCNFVTIFLGRNLLQFCDHFSWSEFIAIF